MKPRCFFTPEERAYCRILFVNARAQPPRDLGVLAVVFYTRRDRAAFIKHRLCIIQPHQERSAFALLVFHVVFYHIPGVRGSKAYPRYI